MKSQQFRRAFIGITENTQHREQPEWVRFA